MANIGKYEGLFKIFGGLGIFFDLLFKYISLKIAEGTEHDIYLDGNIVIKIPKKYSNFEKAKSRIEATQHFFGNYILDTIIEPGENGYILKQEFIDGKTINTDNLDSVRNDLLDLLDLHFLSFNQTGVGIDFIGLEGTIKSILFRLSKYKGTKIDNYIITPFFTKVSGKNYYFGRLLKFWNSNPLPELANIMVDGKGKIKVIDLSSTGINEDGIKGKARALVLEYYNKYYFKKFFNIIYKK